MPFVSWAKRCYIFKYNTWWNRAMLAVLSKQTTTRKKYFKLPIKWSRYACTSPFLLWIKGPWPPLIQNLGDEARQSNFVYQQGCTEKPLITIRILQFLIFFTLVSLPTVYVWHNKNIAMHIWTVNYHQCNASRSLSPLNMQLVPLFKPFASDIQYNIWSDPKTEDTGLTCL